jgi:hypothetical protein
VLTGTRNCFVVSWFNNTAVCPLQKGFLCGSDCISIVLQVMLPYVWRLLTLQFEEQIGTEELCGVSSIQVQMSLSFLQSKHDIYVFPFCPLQNVIEIFFLFFCILFFYLALLTLFFFLQNFGDFFHDTCFPDVLPINSCCSANFTNSLRPASYD